MASSSEERARRIMREMIFMASDDRTDAEAGTEKHKGGGGEQTNGRGRYRLRKRDKSTGGVGVREGSGV